MAAEVIPRSLHRTSYYRLLSVTMESEVKVLPRPLWPMILNTVSVSLTLCLGAHQLQSVLGAHELPSAPKHRVSVTDTVFRSASVTISY